MKSNFPEDVENPKRAQLQKQFKAWRKRLGEGGRGCKDSAHQKEEREKHSNAAKGRQIRGAWAAEMMHILPKALQDQPGSGPASHQCGKSQLLAGDLRHRAVACHGSITSQPVLAHCMAAWVLQAESP